MADLDNALQKCKSQGNCRQVEEEFKARSDENRRRLNGCVAAGNCAEIRAEIDAGSTALNELVARQETANPGGSDSDIAYGFLMGRNVVDWTTAGQLHLEQTANLWWNGNPQWQKEVGAYLDQTGFNPFGIGVPAMGGAAGKVSAKALMNALKAGELPKGEVAPGKANLPTIGALADAEAGMPYTHPVKEATKTKIPNPPRAEGNFTGGPLENAIKTSGRFKLDGGPANGVLYRSDNKGNVTSYAVYDSTGMIIKRVDVSGASHANIPTPHVIEYGRNILPDGSVRVQSPSTKLAPRPANSDEIP
ncbi:polymorphic toxin type 24 domain-containing protein [Pseudomonas aeruginosa]|nr:polymorphic toxin type 24 domain-containing protein [Pseudomonas aeruginosa]UXH61789.1 polymorphic toxin type 24 domain-containing protein [Pseudomonas aeruginosa]